MFNEVVIMKVGLIVLTTGLFLSGLGLLILLCSSILGDVL